MSASYVLRRLLGVVPALFGVLVVTFALVYAIPGDPAVLLAGEGAAPERVQEIRHQLELDQPLPEQFVSYASRLVRGDLGQSTTLGQPVTQVIGDRIGPTLLLTGTALALSTLFGLFLGSVAARRPYGRLDFAINTSALVGYAVPAFWLGQVAVIVFALHFNLFPLLGYMDVRHDYTGLAHATDVAYHLMLPAMVLAFSEVALLARVTRSGLLQELGRDYVRTARAKGLSEQQVGSHAMRNAMLPVVTVIGTRVGFLFSGAVVIEAVFSWPGLGSVVVEAARGADRQLMLGLVLVAAVAVILANLVTDLVYAWIDPRVGRD